MTLGTLGVRFFFTLSGFLITGILLRGQSIGRFYTRRALRIFPAYYACLLVVVLAVLPRLADTFDAVTHSRRYRTGKGVDSAADILASGRGTQFDPEVVCAFCRAFLKEIEGSKERRLLNLLNRNYSNVETVTPLLNQLLADFDGGATAASTNN